MSVHFNILHGDVSVSICVGVSMNVSVLLDNGLMVRVGISVNIDGGKCGSGSDIVSVGMCGSGSDIISV